MIGHILMSQKYQPLMRASRSAIGTIWSSSPCRTSVGTEILQVLGLVGFREGLEGTGTLGAAGGAAWHENALPTAKIGGRMRRCCGTCCGVNCRGWRCVVPIVNCLRIRSKGRSWMRPAERLLAEEGTCPSAFGPGRHVQ